MMPIPVFFMPGTVPHAGRRAVRPVEYSSGVIVEQGDSLFLLMPVMYGAVVITTVTMTAAPARMAEAHQEHV